VVLSGGKFMWSKSVELLNPYKALMENNENKISKQRNKKNIIFTSGTNIYDFFVLPTIRINSDCDITFVTAEWLKWFIGVKWYR
jgi:hypothetical protein